MLEDTENWLYEDGEDQPKQVYEEKLDALKVCFTYSKKCSIFSVQASGFLQTKKADRLPSIMKLRS